MQSDLSVDACVTIRGNCPAEYMVCGELVEFHFGGPLDGFHFAFDTPALHRLVSLGTEAITRLEQDAVT